MAAQHARSAGGKSRRADLGGGGEAGGSSARPQSKLALIARMFQKPAGAKRSVPRGRPQKLPRVFEQSDNVELWPELLQTCAAQTMAKSPGFEE